MDGDTKPQAPAELPLSPEVRTQIAVLAGRMTLDLVNEHPGLNTPTCNRVRETLESLLLLHVGFSMNIARVLIERRRPIESGS